MAIYFSTPRTPITPHCRRCLRSSERGNPEHRELVLQRGDYWPDV